VVAILAGRRETIPESAKTFRKKKTNTGAVVVVQGLKKKKAPPSRRGKEKRAEI